MDLGERIITATKVFHNQVHQRLASLEDGGNGTPRSEGSKALQDALRYLLDALDQLKKAHKPTERSDTTEEVLTACGREATILAQFQCHLNALEGTTRLVLERCQSSLSPDSPALHCNTIVQYAHALRYTTFAPCFEGPMVAPNPQTFDMLASSLYAFHRAEQQKLKEAAAQVMAEHPQTEMDVVLEELFLNLPPGWKPGDPIPGLDSLELGIPQQLSQTMGSREPSVSRDTSMPPDPEVTPTRPAFDVSFLLNPDLVEVEDLSSEEYSDDEY